MPSPPRWISTILPSKSVPLRPPSAAQRTEAWVLPSGGLDPYAQANRFLVQPLRWLWRRGRSCQFNLQLWFKISIRPAGALSRALGLAQADSLVIHPDNGEIVQREGSLDGIEQISFAHRRRHVKPDGKAFVFRGRLCTLVAKTG